MADDKVKKANKVYQKAVDNGMPTEAKQVTKVSGDLAKFYNKYLADVNLQIEKWLESYSSLSFSQKLQVERLLNVKNTINDIMGEPSTSIKQTVQDFVQTQGKDAYNSIWYQLEQGYNLSLDFPVLNPNYLEQLMNAPVAGSNLSKRLKDNVDNLAKASNDAIARGFMLGKGYAEIALDISTETQASYNRAVRIARTEGGRVSSLTTQKGYEEAVNSGVHMQKMWMATLDSKTRMDHSHVDGQIIDVDDYFNVGGYKALGPHQTGVAREDVNCRCTSRPIVSGIMPTVRLDNEKKVTTEWKSYDDWLKEQSEKNAQDIMKNPSMNEMFGSKNYNNFLNSLNSIEDSPMKSLIEKMGSQLQFEKGEKDLTKGKIVQLTDTSFKESKERNAMQVVFHEISHAIDNLGVKSLGSDFVRVSTIPEYGLKKAINNDLLNLFNNDLAEIKGDDYQKLKNLKKMDIFDQGAIVRKYKKLAEENPKMYSSLSDMMESTGAFIHHPLGSGHGLNYWKPYGTQEAEFFAHMGETLVNKDSGKMMYELFPTASKKWEKILNDILKSINN